MSTAQTQHFDKVIKILERYCDYLERQLENKKNGSDSGEAELNDLADNGTNAMGERNG